MSGRKISLGKSVKIKDGKVIVLQQYRDASHKIRAAKSKRQRVVRPTLKGD
jgi:hypothetical protein